MTPKTRRWKCAVLLSEGILREVEVNAPARFLAQLNAADALGLPLLWGSGRINVTPIRPKKTDSLA